MTHPALSPGARLGHYTIVERLGAGGMGEVYRARDEGLEREVVLKVLPEETVSDPVARARLLREARTASSLNHAHICTIHEVGEEGNQVFIAMELVEGRPLTELVGATGMPSSTVLRYGVEMADALAHAHGRNVIHRDLKSANVMVTSEGHIKVLDFGLARRVPTAGSSTVVAPGLSLTETGAIVGTPHYMSPEVLHGAEADARSDVWALGVLLHEMVSGEMPFAGQTAFEVAAAIMHAPPGPLPPSVPAGLRAVVGRCLEKEPAHRYARAGEVRAALEALQSDPGRVAEIVAVVSSRKRHWAASAGSRPWLLPGIGAVAVVVAALWVVNPGGWRDRFGSSDAETLRSLAVLPLANLSGDPQQDYFADGMTDELITSLGKISALKVIARTSVMEYKGRRSSLRDVARALKVSAVIEGSVLQAQGRVRITARLIQVATGKLLWSESYERSLRDVLALQSDVALAIAREIQVKLTPQEQTQLAALRPVDPEAFKVYLKGRAAWGKYTLEGFQESEGLFRRAIEIAPTYAPAWAGLADAAYGMSSIHLPPNVAIPRARAAAEKALALDESLAEAHTSFGSIRMVYDWDWPGAEREFDRAIALRPGDANAHLWRGHLLTCQGRSDEGLAAIRRALDLDPLSLWISANLGWHLYHARRYDQALEHLQNAVQANPEYYIFHVFLGLVREQQGDHAGAIAALEQAVKLDTNSDNLAQLAHAYGTAGRRQDAEHIIAQLLERRTHSFVPAGNIAMAYAGLGDREEALRWFERAIEDHSEWLIFLKVDPGLDALRPDPRFAALLRRLGFER